MANEGNIWELNYLNLQVMYDSNFLIVAKVTIIFVQEFKKIWYEYRCSAPLILDMNM